MRSTSYEIAIAIHTATAGQRGAGRENGGSVVSARQT
jgi:hypothetical protein